MFSHLISVHLLALMITICGDGNCEMNVNIASQGTVLIEQMCVLRSVAGGGVYPRC